MRNGARTIFWLRLWTLAPWTGVLVPLHQCPGTWRYLRFIGGSRNGQSTAVSKLPGVAPDRTRTLWVSNRGTIGFFIATSHLWPRALSAQMKRDDQ